MPAPALNATSREIFFYHSFPRHHQYDNKRRTLALRTLASILKNGLLLTAEAFPDAPGFPPVQHVQLRACFTALHPSVLKKHCRRFGSFSLEFGGNTMREFGAQPAFYLAAPIPGGALLNQAGNETAFHLSDAYMFLNKMWTLRDSEVSDIVAKAARYGIKHDPKKIAKLKRSVLHVSNTLWQPRMDGHAFQHLVFGLQALLNLYYQTEAPGNTPLQFFEQREWKIIPNFAYDRSWHYPKLKPRQKRELLAINPKFFRAKVGGAPRIEQCALLSPVGGRNIVNEIRRIIVPRGFKRKVEAMVKKARKDGWITSEIPVVGSWSLPGKGPPDGTHVEPCHPA